MSNNVNKKNTGIKFLLIFTFLISISSANAQAWDIHGNAGIQTSNFVGTLGSEPLNFATNRTVRMTLEPKFGFLGIGIQKPNWNLHLHDNVVESFRNVFQMTNAMTGVNANKDGFVIFQEKNRILMQQRENDLFKIEGLGGGMTIAPNGDVGFGTDIPYQKIHLVGGNNILLSGRSYRSGDPKPRNSAGSPNGSILFGFEVDENCPWGVWGIEYETNMGLNFHQPWSPCQTGGNHFLFLANNGNIGIGTNTPAERLVVNGKICAKEVRVALSGAPCWPDFVFSKDYRLMSLPEMEAYIKKNGHLPEVPSAAEVEENGIELGEMNALLLKKIEELTLHIINMEKRISELENTKGGEE